MLTGCADTRYYWQSVTGHLQLMQAARPVDDWLADRASPAALQQRLKLAQAMRRFAVTELHLPDNASYHRYADLQRRHAVWNVVAAPELSLTLKTWCFPVAGCVGYRGYFAEADAQAQAQDLQRAGARRQRLWCARLLDAGLDELARRRPAAQHLHLLPRRRGGAAAVS